MTADWTKVGIDSAVVIHVDDQVFSGCSSFIYEYVAYKLLEIDEETFELAVVDTLTDLSQPTGG